MPPLQGFSDNPFNKRADLEAAVYALLKALIPYQSAHGARIRLPVGTAAHFDEAAAQLEGFARPLWAIGALLAAKSPDDPIDPRLWGWINGFGFGTDPDTANDEYWGDIDDKDQRMVEVEILAYALLAAPVAFLGPPDSVEEADVKKRQTIIRYLRSVNGKDFPQNNWLWFRVMGNLALVQSCGVPYSELKESINADLKVLDSFYVSDGWASDGYWNEGGRQMDYYSGSFAIQFSQLMYVRYAADLDPERVEVYKKRAQEFAVNFWRYFNDEGAAIPFGRSLTYRFAMGGFWGAAIMADVNLPAPLTPGIVKGLLCRHLRYWAGKHDIFYPDGTLNIGFHYPNMYMSEDYNSPQSPYWCLKTFCLLTLPESHPFWAVKEEAHPLSLLPNNERKLQVKLLKQPRHILIDSGNHHFLLSSGQYCGWPMKATHAKYTKFAYSSSFGFSVPTGQLIQQLAPDNTLALSDDDGETWKSRLKSEETQFGTVSVHTSKGTEEAPTLISTWSSSKRDNEVRIETTLIPSTGRWPDWHIRIHKLTLNPNFSPSSLLTVEGGFAIAGQKTSLTEPRSLASFPLQWNASSLPIEGILTDEFSALIISSAGASGIRHLCSCDKEELGSVKVKGEVMRPDSNTNLIEQRTLIPTIAQTVFEKTLGGPAKGKKEFVVGTAVFAISGKKLDIEEVKRRWEDAPVISFRGTPKLDYFSDFRNLGTG